MSTFLRWTPLFCFLNMIPTGHTHSTRPRATRRRKTASEISRDRARQRVPRAPSSTRDGRWTSLKYRRPLQSRDKVQDILIYLETFCIFDVKVALQDTFRKVPRSDQLSRDGSDTAAGSLKGAKRPKATRTSSMCMFVLDQGTKGTAHSAAHIVALRPESEGLNHSQNTQRREILLRRPAAMAAHWRPRRVGRRRMGVMTECTLAILFGFGTF